MAERGIKIPDPSNGLLRQAYEQELSSSREIDFHWVCLAYSLSLAHTRAVAGRLARGGNRVCFAGM